MRINPSLKTYTDLFHARGIKLVTKYFFECHFFDLKNKTDTHLMVAKSEMHVDSDNFAHSLMYMVSWTSVIKSATRYVKEELMLDERNYKFIDIGCGKGKVIIVSRQTGIVGSNPLDYIGIDFDEELIQIARLNSQRVFGDKGSFIMSDIVSVDFKLLGENLILFLYNPFDQFILSKLILNLAGIRALVVYVNPAHREVLLEHGFASRLKQENWHPNLSFEVFESPHK